MKSLLYEIKLMKMGKCVQNSMLGLWVGTAPGKVSSIYLSYTFSMNLEE